MRGPSVLQFLIIASLVVETVAYLRYTCPGYDEKYKCGGWWWWTKYCKRRKCHACQVTCRCPGNGQEVTFNVDSSVAYGSCRPRGGVSNAWCQQYRNCASCRGGSGIHNGCYSCRPGFQLGNHNSCGDVNECLRTSTCEHNCTNTIGSFYCFCRYGYRLNNDRRTCQKRSCGHPGNIDNGRVVASGSFMFDSYAEYFCDSNQLTLVGNSVRKCLSNSYYSAYWGGQSPKCVGGCDSSNSTKRQCGPPNVNETQCLQLGCCYSGSGQPTCYHRNESSSLTYEGEKPRFHNESIPERTPGGCRYACDQTSWCKSFGIEKRTSDAAVKHRTCYLYDKSRSQLLADKQISLQARNFDLYERLHFGTTEVHDNSTSGDKLDISTTSPGPTTTTSPTTTAWTAADQCCLQRTGCFVEHAQKHGWSGQPRPEFRTLDDCKAACWTGNNCRGLDWDPDNADSKNCWLFREQTSLGYSRDISHYTPNRNCSQTGTTHSESSAKPTTDSPQIIESVLTGGPGGGGRGGTVATADMKMLHVGCYENNERNSKQRLWSSERNTPESCVASCRQQGYTVARLRDGKECYCDTDDAVTFGKSNSLECNQSCPGGSCGGVNSSSVYRVPSEKKYVGCYPNGDADLQQVVWKRPGTPSVSDCVDSCREANYLSAAVRNGDQCYCGNGIGRRPGDQVHYDECRVPCAKRIRESCGGPTTTAVYDTGLGVSIASKMSLNYHNTKLYSQSTTLVEIPMILFTEYPRLKSITTPRLTILATESVITPDEDPVCSSSDCYKLCGDISSYESRHLHYRGRDQIVRFFFVNLANLSNYVGVDAERVYVYAQTVLIDSDLKFPYTLQVYTRQLIVDRQKAKTIRVSGTSPVLELDFTEPRSFGVEVDSTFQKQSLICARILLDTRSQSNINIAWAVLHNLAHGDVTADAEKAAWIKSVRMFIGFLSGIERQNVRFVPFLSKTYFKEILRLYYERISLYKRDFDKLLDSSLSAPNYIRNVEEMTKIYSTTSVAEAKSEFDSKLSAIVRSEATYNNIRREYDVAASYVLYTAERTVRRQKRGAGAAFDLGFGIAGLFIDLLGFGFDQYDRQKEKEEKLKMEALERRLEGELNQQFDNLVETLMAVGLTVRDLHRFMNVSEEVSTNLRTRSTTFDYSTFLDDIELSIIIKTRVVYWRNLKNVVETIMNHPYAFKTSNLQEFLRSVVDLCNWGEALSNSAAEHAELLRSAIQSWYTLDSKNRQTTRLKDDIKKLKAAAEVERMQKQLMTAAMAEQLHDVRIDLNNILFSFCQAYFFENMRDCAEDYRPSFGGSLSDILLKINKALVDSSLISAASSTVNSRIEIVDSKPPDLCCCGAADCPVNNFRHHGVFVFRLPDDHPAMVGLTSYRVREIFIDFVGAKPNATTGLKTLRVGIESSGIFRGKDDRMIYNFVSRAVSLAYQYDVETDHVSIHADVYAPQRSLVQHITPYTTWIVRLSEVSAGIDLTNLTAIVMRFTGGARVNSRVKRAASEENEANCVSGNAYDMTLTEGLEFDNFKDLLKYERNRFREEFGCMDDGEQSLKTWLEYFY